jgi:hypothetical protein
LASEHVDEAAGVDRRQFLVEATGRCGAIVCRRSSAYLQRGVMEHVENEVEVEGGRHPRCTSAREWKEPELQGEKAEGVPLVCEGATHATTQYEMGSLWSMRPPEPMEDKKEKLEREELTRPGSDAAAARTRAA